MRRRLAIVVVVFLVLLTLVAAGPRPVVDETVRFDPATVSADLDGWLAEREAAVAGLKDGAQKEIVWADPATKARTPLAIVYIHGFSATKWETRPLPDKVAAGLGANLFFTRLTGHGGDGAMLASASMNDWINDVAEAIAVGERIGEKIVIIGASTGGTLAALGRRTTATDAQGCRHRADLAELRIALRLDRPAQHAVEPANPADDLWRHALVRTSQRGPRQVVDDQLSEPGGICDCRVAQGGQGPG